MRVFSKGGKQIPFTMVPKQFVGKAELDGYDKAILTEILSLSPSFPSYEYLMQETKWSRNRVMKSIRKLESLKLIQRFKRSRGILYVTQWDDAYDPSHPDQLKFGQKRTGQGRNRSVPGESIKRPPQAQGVKRSVPEEYSIRTPEVRMNPGTVPGRDANKIKINNNKIIRRTEFQNNPSSCGTEVTGTEWSFGKIMGLAKAMGERERVREPKEEELSRVGTHSILTYDDGVTLKQFMEKRMQEGGANHPEVSLYTSLLSLGSYQGCMQTMQT